MCMLIFVHALLYNLFKLQFLVAFFCFLFSALHTLIHIRHILSSVPDIVDMDDRKELFQDKFGTAFITACCSFRPFQCNHIWIVVC